MSKYKKFSISVFLFAFSALVFTPSAIAQAQTVIDLENVASILQSIQGILNSLKESLAAENATAQTLNTAFGKGIFAHVVADRGTKERDRNLWEFWARDTAVAGTQLSYGWDVLEPQQGQYRWDIVRAHMAPWTKYNKKVWIEIQTVNKRSVGNEGLPGWVRSKISTVKINNDFGEVTYPVFWEAEYQKHWFAFLDAFAREFDGDPGIEFVSTGGYSPGHEPRGYGSDDGENPDLLRQLGPYGYDGLGVNGVWYQKAFVPIVSYYAKIFHKTRIAQTLTYNEPASAAMQELVGGRGLDYIFINNGFSYKHATSAAQAEHRNRSLTYDADVGMAEFGPAGVGSLSITELYREAIGDPNNPNEYSRLSYLPLPAELLLPGNQAAIQGVQWANDNLRNWRGTSVTPPPPVPSPVPPPQSTKFLINDRVQATSNLNVRSTPSTSGTLLGTQPSGAQGIVIGGPTFASNLWWWNINYNSGVDGWSAEGFLVKTQTSLPPPAPTPLPTPPAPTPSGWNLIWSDEFNNTGLPDSSKWGYDSDYGFGDQYFTKARSENARVENGTLVIEARKESYQGAKYTAALIETRGKASWTYGRMEVRAKLPEGRGVWPAIWTLAVSGGWPASGEIDIMEYVGFDPDKVYANVHGRKDGTHYQSGPESYSLLRPYDNFHVYALEWFPDRMDFFVDGNKYHTYSNNGSNPWPFDKPQYLILNLAIGGEWGGQQGIDDSIFPQKYIIDYVRVYQQGAVSVPPPAPLPTPSPAPTPTPTPPSPVPAPTPTPAPPSTAGWYLIPNTRLRDACPTSGNLGNCLQVVQAWGGGAVDTLRNRLLVWGGGHTDYYGNELYALDLNSLNVRRLTNPGPRTSDAETLSDGTPNSRHTYDGLAYITHADRLFSFGGSIAGSGNCSGATWTLDLKTLKWQNMNPGNGPLAKCGAVSAYDPNTKQVLVHDGDNLYAYTFETNSYRQLSGYNETDYHMTAAIDPVRKKFVIVGGGWASNGGVFVYDISPGGGYTVQKWSTSGGDAIVNSASPGLAYDPVSDRIVAWNGGNIVYSLNMDTKMWTAATYSGGPGAAPGEGTFSRFDYVPGLNVFAVVNSVDDNAYTLRLNNAAGTPLPSPPVPSPVPPPQSTKFLINDRVQATSNLNVRSTPSTSGTLLGTQPSGAQGIVIGGPTFASNLWWWNINYNSGVDGWSAEGFLVKTQTSLPPPAPTPPAPLPPPFSSGQITLPLRTWVATSLAGYGNGPCQSTAFGGCKHMRLAHNPVDGRIYFSGGDWSGPNHPQSGRNETYSYSIRDNNWRLEYPYCGPASEIQPGGPDETGWVYDTKRNIFWLTSGFYWQWQRTGECPGGAEQRTSPVMNFNPSTKKWTDVQAPNHGIDPNKVRSNGVYDPVEDTIIQLSNDINGGTGVLLYRIASNIWEKKSITFDTNGTRIDNASLGNGQYHAVDLVKRHVYVISPDDGKLLRYNMDAKTITVVSQLPVAGPYPPYAGYGHTTLAWDSVNKVLLWPHEPVLGGQITLYIYHPDTNTWEKDSMYQPQGLMVHGRQIVFDPFQNALLTIGSYDTDPSNAQKYFFLYRYSSGSGGVASPPAPVPAPTPVPAPAPTPSPSTKFLINDRVQATSNLNVRSTPSTSGTLLGTQPSGAQGIVIGGPTFASNLWWWNINYNSGVDGWSAEGFLVKTQTSLPPPPVPTPIPPAPTSTPPSSTLNCSLPNACGPALGMPNSICSDGTIGGPTGRCLNRGDVCGWEVVSCPIIPPSPTPPVACTQDTKLCPDGSYVSRVAPSCEFAACPGSTPSLPQSPRPRYRHFLRSLFRGLRHADVAVLQRLLIREGFLSSGNDTSFFGPLTENAVRNFQCTHNIVCGGSAYATGWGRVGPRTREKLEERADEQGL